MAAVPVVYVVEANRNFEVVRSCLSSCSRHNGTDVQSCMTAKQVAMASLPYVTDVRAGFFYMCCVFVKKRSMCNVRALTKSQTMS